MTTNSKRELLAAIKRRYRQASLPEKTRILDEYCAATGYHRKYATRILQAGHSYRQRRRWGQRHYRGLASELILAIWELLDYPCGARLKPMLVPLGDKLWRYGVVRECPPMVREQLQRVSKNTLDRSLRRERRLRRLGRGRSTTRHGSLLKSSVPIRLTNWNTQGVGFMEMDTVAHCGDQLSGEFIYSLDMVEIATGWSEQLAILGKGEAGLVKAIDTIKQDLPFTLHP